MEYLLLLLTFNCFIYNVLSKESEIINGPQSPNEWQSWIVNISSQRAKDLKSIDYNGSIYNVASLQWTQSSFIQPQMHGYDAYFYDGVTHSYTFDKYLNDLKTRYGGIDSYLFWVTYTNIGADDRNQFEMNYAVPRSIDGLKKMVDYMHAQHPPIQVLFPYNPWDQGTHYSGMEDYEMMAKFLNETGADGFNGDTMGFVPEYFYTYSVNKYKHPIAIEPEGDGNLTSMNWDNMGWGKWQKTGYTNLPFVGRWKWYDARRMTYMSNRWAQNHTNDIQNIYFNGLGFASWENVWGCWNGMVPRDGEALRRIATILRYFGNRNKDETQQNFTQSLEWLPFIPIINDTKYWNDLFASRFIVENGTDKQQILFLIVNRNSIHINNATISFNNTFKINADSLHVYDCYHGSELTVTNINKKIVVNIDVEGLGFGCILATMDARTDNKNLNNYLSTMNNQTQKPLSSFSTEWKYLLQTMSEIGKTKLYSSPPDTNMVTIPKGIFYFNNSGVEIEGNDQQGVDVQYPWELHPQREHSQSMTIDKFYIDKYPVTCSKYNSYLKKSNYVPSDSYNYLKNWRYNESTKSYTYPAGYDNKPVTYLGLNEARSFCAFNGKRLPHSYEWQYSAQGNTSYLYPWGNTQEMGTKFPQSQHGRTLPGPQQVTKYSPKSDSVFGVADLIGNVWQYTDEFTDPHTRSVVVMGSANYRPNGSKWYFPVAYQLNQHNKYFLMDDSYERCGTIGFRCAADAIQSASDDIYNWNGNGNYCTGLNTANGVLCGMINSQKGFNDLTIEGTLDWIQLGTNSKDNSQFNMIRKQTDTKYINNVESENKVKTYLNNPNAFYWSDGETDIPVLTKDNATMDAIYISDEGIKFEIGNLSKGNVYKLRVYVGVYKDGGDFAATLTIGTNTYSFSDSSVFNGGGTTNIAYDLIINLKSVTNDSVKLLIDWIVGGKGEGNITLQAITLSLVST